MCSGRQRTIGEYGGASNPRGRTPTIVTDCPSSEITRPITSRAPPKRVCHISWVSSATVLSRPSRSDGSISRPSSGRTPSAAKKPGVARPPLIPSAPCVVARWKGQLRAIPIAASARDRAAMSSTLGGEMLHQSAGALGYCSQIVTSRPAFANASGRSTMPLTTPKMVVVRPMPSARVRMAVMLKAGCAARPRSA